MPAVDLISWQASNLGAGSGASSLTYSSGPSMSDNGRYLVFQSDATDLVTGQEDNNGAKDIFLRDRVTQTTTLISRSAASALVTGDAESINPSISADGRYIVFQSRATNFVTGQDDTNGAYDVFLHDRLLGETVLLSHQSDSATKAGNGASTLPQISADGSQVVFVSNASNLVTGQAEGNVGSDVFVAERATRQVTLVSHAAGQPATTANNVSDSPSISSNGRYIVFHTFGTNLAAGIDDQNSDGDVYLYDRVTTTTTLVSHAAGVLTSTGDRASEAPRISADGSAVVFAGYATNLEAGLTDNNFNMDVFVYDRASQAITLVSRSATGTTSGDNFSYTPVVSANGQYVAFASAASNLVTGQVDDNGDLDVFLFDRVSGTQTLVSHLPNAPTTAGAGFAMTPAISGDGRVIVFVSTVANHVEGVTDTNSTLDVFSYDRATTELSLLSPTAADPNVAGDGLSELPQITPSGRIVVFQSESGDLLAGDSNLAPDVFVYALPNSRPIAQANGPYDVVEGGSVVLSAAGSSDLEQPAEALQYEWDLDGDGVYGEVGANALYGDETGTAPTLTLTGVNGPTSITVFLRVTDDGGLSATAQATVLVSNAAPTASIGGPYNVAEVGIVQLSGSGSDPGGDTLTYEWDLDGDGVFGETGVNSVRGNETIANPIFSAAGLDGPTSWQVAFRVVDQDGLASDPVTTIIQVTNAAPTGNANGPYSVGEGRTVRLNGTGSDPATFLDPLTYTWDLDADGVFGETGVDAVRGDELGQKPYFSPNGLDGPSAWTIWMKVTDDEGASHTSQATVNITNTAPTADGDGPYACVEGSSVVLSGAGADAGGDTLTYDWDLDGDGVYGETGASALHGDEVGQHPTFSGVGLDGPTTWSVTLRVTDDDGLSATDIALIEVANAAPNASLGGPYTVAEGGQITLQGSATDSGGDGLTYQWDLDGDGLYGETGADALRGNETGTSPVFNASGLDGPTMVPIALRVTDDDGLAGSIQTGMVTILPAAPTANLNGPTSAVRGQVRSFTFGASDASPLDQAAGFTYQIDWGDGKLQQVVATPGNGAGVSLDHTFTAEGIFNVKVTAMDRDGQISQVHSQPVTIAVVQMQPDPRNAARTALVVGGTTLNDRIVFAPGRVAGEVRVYLNNRLLGTYRPTGRLIAYGQSGADSIIVQAGVRLQSELFGGAGNDVLVGGANHNLLVGDIGNDILRGNIYRDVLIGGAGSDQLYGGGGEDILVAGACSYDRNELALRQIHQAWLAATPFSVRVALLKNRAQTYYLVPGVTVLSDGAADRNDPGTQQNWVLPG
ncbi:MAG: PKD domain-containing protein [Gemmataceae bacterium]